MNFSEMINESAIDNNALKALLPEIQMCLNKSDKSSYFKKLKITKNKVNLTLNKEISINTAIYFFKDIIARLGLVYEIKNNQKVSDTEISFEMEIDIDETLYYWATYEERLKDWYMARLANVFKILLDIKSDADNKESVFIDYIFPTFEQKYVKNIKKLGYPFTIEKHNPELLINFDDEKFAEDVRWAYSHNDDSVKNKVLKTIDLDEIEDDFKSKFSFFSFKTALFYIKSPESAQLVLKAKIDYEGFRKYIRLESKRRDDKTKIQIIKELCKYDRTYVLSKNTSVMW